VCSMLPVAPDCAEILPRGSLVEPIMADLDYFLDRDQQTAEIRPTLIDYARGVIFPVLALRPAPISLKLLERTSRLPLVPPSRMGGFGDGALFYDLIREAILGIEFECSRLHDHCA
jgi:hypothetical protein